MPNKSESRQRREILRAAPHLPAQPHPGKPKIAIFKSKPISPPFSAALSKRI